MSAIFGIYRIDGRPVLRAELLQMRCALAHRTPYGAAEWSQGHVGIGQQRLCPTPESLSALNDALLITAAARLDNRAELIKWLDLTNGSQSVRDGELILKAYQRWGEDCVDKLLGDFAFAIWDARRQTLFCARDHFGVKPFYYYFSPHQQFIFASEPKALFALSETPRRLNRERIADFLADICTDSESTFYRDILRLPPAHRLSINASGMRLQRYWSLDPQRETRLSNDHIYAEAFRELFTEAVKCRLRAAEPVGSMLSGGLDSSSITCVASDVLSAAGSSKLKTFSAVFDAVAECDERSFINLMLDRKNLDPHFIEASENPPFRNLEHIQWHVDQPAYGPNCDMVWSIYEQVAAAGVQVLLDGHDGDTTVSYGDRYLHDLARSGKWISLAFELKGVATNGGPSALRSFGSFAWRYRVDPFANKHRSLRRARSLWRRGFSPEANPTPERWQTLLNSDLAGEINMRERYRSWRHTVSQTASTERDGHFRMLSHPMQSYAFELHDGIAGAFGIEKRYPFWDKRLVEFCLSLPSRQKLSNGWTRAVLRRAMEGILPREIQWRIDKTNFVPRLAYGIRAFERDELHDVFNRNPEPIAEYVNLEALREAMKRFLDPGCENGSTDLFPIWKAVSLSSWLQHRGRLRANRSAPAYSEGRWWSCSPTLGALDALSKNFFLIKPKEEIL